MEEIVKDTTENKQQPEQTGRTFTQEEVNRIVSDRLARDREKRTAELDEREKAVKARELAVVAVEKLTAAGLPKEMAGVLKYDDEKTLDEAIATLSHLSGFGSGKDTSQKEGRKIIENKLPRDDSDYEETLDSSLKAAFRPTREWSD